MYRLAERQVVKDFTMPKVPNADLYDQCGFKASGSIVAALVDITLTTSVLLETNNICSILVNRFR